MRKTVVWSAVAALVVAPMLAGCSNTRRARRTQTANRSSNSSNGVAMIPPAPPMSAPYAGADSTYAPNFDAGGFDAGGFGAPGEVTYVDPGMPGGIPSMAPGSIGTGTGSSLGATSAELAASRAELDRLRAEQEALTAELNMARDRMAESQDALIEQPPLPSGGGFGGATDVPVDRAVADLEALLRSQAAGAEVVRQGDRVIVRLTDGFKSGDDQLRSPSQAQAVARATKAALERYPDARVEVVGHSDSSPIVKTKDRWSSNQHLSEARARAVASQLAGAGIAGRIDVQGRGASQPLVSPERSASDRARNRRVEIVISL